MPVFDEAIIFDPPVVWEDTPAPPPPPPGIPTNGRISTDDILNLVIPNRSDRFEFDLLDQTHTKIGTVTVDQTAAPTVTVNTTQNATRALTSLAISGTDLSQIDPIRNRIQPWMILQNGDRFPLGIYMFGQDNDTQHSWGTTKTPELVDETFRVDRALDSTATLPTGGSIISLINTLLAPIGLVQIVIEAADQACSSPLLYRVGSGRYAALAALASLLGCYPPFFDNAGAFRFKVAPSPTDTTINDTYALGGRIIADTIVTSSTAYRAPNRYQVIGDNVDTPVVGIYDLPASAPHSAAQTGEIVTTTRNMQGLSDQNIANVAAYVDALTDRTTYRTIAFSSTADPRHDTYDLMNVLGDRYLETGWSLQCSNGGVMTHQGNILWQ